MLPLHCTPPIEQFSMLIGRAAIHTVGLRNRSLDFLQIRSDFRMDREDVVVPSIFGKSDKITEFVVYLKQIHFQIVPSNTVRYFTIPAALNDFNTRSSIESVVTARV